MNPALVSILAQIVAAQARIAGMSAENNHRLACGNSVAYTEGAFFDEANALEGLAVEANATKVA